MKHWTESQKEAYKAHGNLITVSASAGSGKTAVLVERVIQLVLSQESYCPADKFLIVTFTNDAANEVKRRIFSRLNEEVTKNHENINLRSQLNLINFAFIGTIHSFCAMIVRENYKKIGISKDFKIDENSNFKISVIEKVLSDIYNENEQELFKMIELFDDERDGNLINILDKFYGFLNSIVDPDLFFRNAIDILKTPLEKNKLGDFLLKTVKENLEFAIDFMDESIFVSKRCDKLREKYLVTIEYDLHVLKSINSLDSFYEILNKLKSFEFSKLNLVRGSKYKEKVNFLLKNAKKIIKKLKSIPFTDSYNDSVSMSSVIVKLFSILKKVDYEMTKLKFKENFLNFSDLEKLTLKVITDNHGEKNKVATSLSNKFQEIMVDEYQDVNEIQDKILRLISRNSKNLFLVGDCKQSVYGFRGASPEIFINKINKKNFININLDKNFRSRLEILNFVNFYFKKFMIKNNTVAYNQNEVLKYGSNYQNRDESVVNFCILEFDSEINQLEQEAILISDKIKDMINKNFKIKKNNEERHINFSDFCILIRNFNKKSKHFIRILKKYGIETKPCTINDLFDYDEIKFFISLLQVIDNPLKNISLIALLLSPIFDFSLSELVDIRSKNSDFYFYFALENIALNCSKLSEKCNIFLERLKKFRSFQINMSVLEFINYLILEIESIFIFSDLEKRNLDKFLEFTIIFLEKNKFKNFSEFVSELSNTENINFNTDEFDIFHENAVNIMSIHRSKGLEFPVCFLAACSTEFSRSDDFLIDRNLGIAFKLKNNEGTIRYPNLFKKSLEMSQKNKQISEELRLLYVALTRAKERLFLIISVKDKKKDLECAIQKLHAFRDSTEIHPYFIKGAKSFSDWLLIIFASEIGS
ncbi:MAG: UvrD-helicase domain-containing protein [Firmicutes bacterium]|nr:UvrD-helicase domain-containing protein [Bacillota bacterium]